MTDLTELTAWLRDIGADTITLDPGNGGKHYSIDYALAQVRNLHPVSITIQSFRLRALIFTIRDHQPRATHCLHTPTADGRRIKWEQIA